MPIHPLPQFEADLEEDRKAYERLKPPSSLVVRFGAMRMIGEFPYNGDVKPGCGTKLVVRTHRGIELGEMLTSTCPNAGCSKSITRKEMLQYIENSGGKDYPFHSNGRVLRIATVDDLNQQARIDEQKREMARAAQEMADGLGLPMRIIEAEPILGGDRLTFYFGAEERVDFRELVSRLAGTYRVRIELRQIGARDEARLTADYERCGQHCCCKQFLKVLKPVSMRNAKIQKATLDPLKISGRCGRLMCCLRYEEQTYDELRARLPRRKSRVGTPHGAGIVLDTQILTQLALVKLDDTGEEIAVPVEELERDPGPGPAKDRKETGGRSGPDAGGSGEGGGRSGRGRDRGADGGGQPRSRRASPERGAPAGETDKQRPAAPPPRGEQDQPEGESGQRSQDRRDHGRKRRRRRRRGGGGQGGGDGERGGGD